MQRISWMEKGQTRAYVLNELRTRPELLAQIIKKRLSLDMQAETIGVFLLRHAFSE